MKRVAKPRGAQGIIERKIERVRSGKPLRVLDLFSGCGGISLGFQAAGFQIEAAVELDEPAAETHARNFHGKLAPEIIARHAKSRDITRLEPDELTEDLQLGPVADAFDVLVGGPPCQAYARVGRAKLREIAEHPKAFKVDPRGNLYLRQAMHRCQESSFEYRLPVKAQKRGMGTQCFVVRQD